MNILVIHEVDYLKRVVYEFQVLSELLSFNHNVYVVDYESMWVKGSIISKQQEMNVARVYLDSKTRLIRPRFIKIPVISRMSAFITHYFAIKKVIKEKCIDIIILYSVPTNGLQVVCLAKKFGIPVIFRSIDNLHKLVSNSILSKITLFLEKIVYRRVSLVLAISNKLTDYVKNLGASNVRILLLGVDTELFKPELDTEDIRGKLGLNENDKVVVFIGTLPLFSGLGEFIIYFEDVIKCVPEAKLVIVGDGEQRSDLEWLVDVCKLRDRVVITGFQPYESIPKYINLADVCICTFPVNGATKDAFPTKIVQYMACGKPVVSKPLLGLNGLGENQGIILTNNLVPEIVKLLKDENKRKELGKKALNYAVKTHSYNKVIAQLEDELAIVEKR